MYIHFFKRLIDILLSLTGIVLLLPLLLLISLLILLDSKGPVLFRQKRIGRNKRTFHILKFRTMRADAPHDIPTHLMVDPEEYHTRVGRILRRTSLDELPQLFNILIGQMSVIGPRPALWNQDDLIAERDKYHANELRPGLTGWAQINGRDELEIEEKARLDGEYAANISFIFDCRCFFGTIYTVLSRDGLKEGGPDHSAQTNKKQGA